MADETNTTAINEVAAGNVPQEKKTRGPRKPKVAAEAAVSTSVSAPVKKTRGPGKRKVQDSAVAPAVAVVEKKASPAKPAGKAQPAKRGPRKVEAKAPATDDFADLLKLEEENQKLRKALSDKLRSENADLRKKLGVA